MFFVFIAACFNPQSVNKEDKNLYLLQQPRVRQCPEDAQFRARWTLIRDREGGSPFHHAGLVPRRFLDIRSSFKKPIQILEEQRWEIGEELHVPVNVSHHFAIRRNPTTFKCQKRPGASLTSIRLVQNLPVLDPTFGPLGPNG